MSYIFHPGELRAQELAGGGPRGAGIRPFLIPQHRDFFPLLPALFAGVPDRAGWPLATVLTGAPGFVTSPDPQTLRVESLPAAEDPAAAGFTVGGQIGLLGLDLATRRRNRANGVIAGLDDRGLTVAVQESFGNCPQYIQTRLVRTERGVPAPIETLSSLDADALAAIAAADTVFVATSGGGAGGVDVSHRGGRPGFVRADGDVLAIPDFSGNRYFNTLGNLMLEPRAGLLFIDFAGGDVLQLQGIAEIDWHGGGLPDGAERSWRFRTTRAWRRRAALPLRWDFESYAPTTARTGLWPA